MRVGGAGQGGFGLVPYGAGAAGSRRREEIEPPDPASRARGDAASAFATSRHPYVRVERMDGPRRGSHDGQRYETAASSPPSVAFLAQFIAQENARDGLELDKSADGARAYRRAGMPPVAIRAGANIDVAA